MMKLTPLIFISCVTLLGACSKAPDQQTAVQEKPISSESHSPAGIEWFQGSVEQAFNTAKQQGKPLFFYWGAVWCPPCNELKATVFKRREFIELTRLFVPVYLDGDTPGAQIYGEKFNVRGYPTLIAFDPDANEITRIPGGLELEKYAEVLQLVLNKIKSVKQLAQQIQNSDSSLSNNDYQLLAYYSWDQDNQQVLPQEGASGVLQKLYESCPDQLTAEKSRLFFAYLASYMREQKTEHIMLAGKEFTAQYLPILNEILCDKQLVLANVTSIRYEDGDTLQFLTPQDSQQRENLIQHWREALRTIAGARSLSTIERLGTLYAEVSLEQLTGDGKISPDLRKKIKSTISQARHNIKNKYEHSAIVNMSRNILVHAEMQDYAEDVIAEEIHNAATPYYFMLELADFAQQEGRTNEALKWFEQAYQDSIAGATRFQWGVYYLGGLSELVPEQETRIKQLALELVGLLARSEDGFYNRNAMRLKEMETHLQKWNKDHTHDEAVIEIQQSLISACRSSGKIENTHGNKVEQCDSYLL